jgi:hypothetical protein
MHDVDYERPKVLIQTNSGDEVWLAASLVPSLSGMSHFETSAGENQTRAHPESLVSFGGPGVDQSHVMQSARICDILVTRCLD